LILEVYSLFCFNFSQSLNATGTDLEAFSIHLFALQIDMLPLGGLDV
jgi:hypothetical protein